MCANIAFLRNTKQILFAPISAIVSDIKIKISLSFTVNFSDNDDIFKTQELRKDSMQN